MPPSTSWPLAAAAALVALAALALVFRGLSRMWPEHLPWGLPPIAIPSATLLWIVLFLPAGGVASHAAALAAVRADPFVLFDASPLAAAGCFHLLAWPLAQFFGDAPAVRMVAALAFAIALLLGHALARGLGAGPWTAFLAQALVLATPEMREPLLSGWYAAVLGTAGELAVLVHLVRRLPVLEAARDGAAACAFLFGAQSLYVGAIPVTLALVLAAAAAETFAGHRRRGRWLLGAYGIALGLAILTQHAWSIPALTREVGAPLAALGAGVASIAALWRLDTALRVALAASLVVTRAAAGAALRAQVAALIAAVLVVALAAGLPARLGLEGHALAFAASPLASLAALGAAGLARRSRVLAVVAVSAALVAMVAGAGSAGH